MAGKVGKEFGEMPSLLERIRSAGNLLRLHLKGRQFIKLDYRVIPRCRYGYGDDPLLDALWDLCALGNRDACDALYNISPIDSSYETFGDTYGASQ